MKAAATLTIHHAAEMSPAGRRAIARWLDQQRKFFLDSSDRLAACYTARYMHREDKKK